MAGSNPRFGTATEAGPIDSLMRALLYIAQQVGRPLSEADVRRLAAVPAAGLDESAFLTAGARLGLETHALDLTAPTGWAICRCRSPCVAAGQPAHVVVTGKGGHWVVLDVVEGRAWRLSTDEVMALGTRALVMREKRPDERREAWYAPLWTRVRPVILKLAAASFAINVLGLATPLFMMLVLNRVIGRDPLDRQRLGHDGALRRHAGRLRARLRAARGARLAVGAHRRAARHADERRGPASSGAAPLPPFRAHAVGRHRRAAASARRAAQLLHRPDAGARHRHRLRGAVPRRHLRHQRDPGPGRRRWRSRSWSACRWRPTARSAGWPTTASRRWPPRARP